MLLDDIMRVTLNEPLDLGLSRNPDAQRCEVS
jgi:hypothetical protein